MTISTAIGVAAAVAVSLTAVGQCRSERVIEAGFWFEQVTFDASEVEADRLGGGVTAQELQTIESIARSELRSAFAGLRVAFTERRDAAYHVRVVQVLRHPFFPRAIGPAGESRGVWPLGGRGAVNFRLLASYAIAHAPPAADRTMMIEGIGRGVGRAAAHEFAHQFLGSTDIHRGRDVQSYEYGNADRAQQYYGPMKWDVAGPLLRARLGPTVSSFQ
jgi:hypothetical protein